MSTRREPVPIRKCLELPIKLKDFMFKSEEIQVHREGSGRRTLPDKEGRWRTVPLHKSRWFRPTRVEGWGSVSKTEWILITSSTSPCRQGGRESILLEE